MPQVGQLNGTPVLDAYPPLAPLQQKRLAARRHKTTYCYDFPSVFGNALREAWAARAAAGEPNAVPPPGAEYSLQKSRVVRLCSGREAHVLLVLKVPQTPPNAELASPAQQDQLQSGQQ